MEEHQLSGPGHKLERLIFFSDAVFAIAITLLVIDLHAPHLPSAASSRDYLITLVNLSPAMMGFTISFFVIGAFWAGHHRAFALARTWDDRLIFPNLVMLFTIAAMPFVTAFMSANPIGRVPALLYTGWLLLAALANVRVQRLVTSAPVVMPGADPAYIAYVRRRGQSVVFAAVTAAAAVAVLPYASMGLALLSTIPLWRRGLTRWLDRTGKAEA